MLTALSLGAVLGLLPAPVLAAAPPPITCGSVITASTHLTTDLTCTDQGITLRGDAMLDLRGHRLSGTSGTGITVVKAGGSAAGVRNGSVTGWTTGLALDHTQDDEDTPVIEVSASRVTFGSNNAGIDASTHSYYGAGWQILVKDSSFAHNDIGIAGGFAAPVSVESSRFLHNRSAVNLDTGGLSMAGSYVADSTLGVGCVEAGCRLSRNTFVHNGTAVSANYFGVTLITNVFTDNDTGYAAFASGDSVVSGNVFDRNKTGVDLLVSSGTLTSNRFSRNATGVTTEALPDQPPLTLKRNLFLINGNAIYLPEGAALQSNSAYNNLGWGIFAPGATDLGGNKARGNRQLPQCVGVVCRP